MTADRPTLGLTLDDRFDIAVKALRRLAVADEMAGMGDVTDPEGRLRIAHARRALAEIGLDQKGKS